ncbi:EFR1 family ferrodoxin [Blautia schinkii]|nr:EFR1 family ferrodoxin [Blautia schinkii]
MKVNCLYFSPTGGTKRVMDFMAEELPVDCWVDLSVRDFDYSQFSFDEKDVCLIAVPSYGGRVPGIVLERLRSMQVRGARAVLVAVYGNRHYDDTLLELRNEAVSSGFVVRAAVAALAEHSIVRQYAAGRPDEEDRKQLHELARKIKSSLEAEGECAQVSGADSEEEDEREPLIPGNMPYREYHGVPVKPKAGKACNKCGKCAQLCPVGAIPKDEPGSVEEEKCISCMRCVSVCPQHARKVNPIIIMATAKKLKNVCSERKENELFIGSQQ